MVIDLQSTEYKRYTDLARSILSERQRYAYVVTFGCQQNEADSETIKGVLADMGYTVTEKQELADIIIVNTCAIREHAESKAFSLLGRFKAQRQENPELIIGVVGCMAADSRVAEALRRDFKYVSFSLEPNRLFELPEAICKILTSGERNFQTGKDNGDLVEGLPKVRQKKHKAWVSIMYGCNNFCSYCIVPYARGRERSRPSCEILKECQELIASGCREITLLGQNVNSYSADIPFYELVEKIADIEGDFIIRFMTSHPKDASDELIALMAKRQDKIAPSFHLPLQSGSDRILRKMNRSYDTERYLSVVDKLRAAIPGIAISTDIIVGFPTESDEDFEATLEILKRVEFDLVYSFLYSKRKGTPAAIMEGQIPDEIKSDRNSKILELQQEISYKNSLGYEGKVLRVLADTRKKKDGEYIYQGRAMNNKSVHFKSSDDIRGEFVNVKITRAAPFDLYGEAEK